MNVRRDQARLHRESHKIRNQRTPFTGPRTSRFSRRWLKTAAFSDYRYWPGRPSALAARLLVGWNWGTWRVIFGGAVDLGVQTARGAAGVGRRLRARRPSGEDAARLMSRRPCLPKTGAIALFKSLRTDSGLSGMGVL